MITGASTHGDQKLFVSLDVVEVGGAQLERVDPLGVGVPLKHAAFSSA